MRRVGSIILIAIMCFMMIGCRKDAQKEISSAEITYADMKREYVMYVQGAEDIKNLESVLADMKYDKTTDHPEDLDGGGTLHINIFYKDGTYLRYFVKSQYFKMAEDGQWYKLDDNSYSQLEKYYKELFNWDMRSENK